MAHDTGMSLSEIYKGIFSETGQQLLNAVRHQRFPINFSIFSEKFDRYILGRTNRFGFPEDSPLNPGDVIEIQGPAASGKTQFLYHLAGRCILPKEIKIPAKCTAQLGGCQSSVVVLDCDNRWDLVRVYNILITRLNVACGKGNASLVDIPAIAMESLSRLHIFRPRSSLQLAATLDSLPTYHAEHMPEEDLRFLFVDSISSFYWMDRWELEPSTSKTASSRTSPLARILRSLQLFKVSHAPIIVLTNWGLYPASSDPSISRSPDPFFRQHLGTPYPSPFDSPPKTVLSGEEFRVDVHITLSDVSKKNPPIIDTPPEETFGHEGPKLSPKDRQKTGDLDAKEVHGYVRIPRIDNGRLSPGGSFGTFKFHILKQDVVTVSEPPV